MNASMLSQIILYIKEECISLITVLGYKYNS